MLFGSHENQCPPTLKWVAVALIAMAPSCVFAATGLGSLEGLQWLFGIVAAIVLVGPVIVVPVLINAFSLRRQQRVGSRIHKVLLGAAIVYLLLLAPLAIGIIVRPILNPGIYAAFIGYLALVAFTVLYFYGNKGQVFGAAGLLLALMIVRTPELVSYTRYDIVDNAPLVNPIDLLPQKDSEYLPFADGRLFFFEERYNGSGLGEKFPSGTQFTVEPASGTDGVALVGVVKAQKYYEHEMTVPAAFITVPLRTVAMDRNEAKSLGRARLLGQNWQPDEAVLFRAVNTFCCDPQWIAELLARGANAKHVYPATDWTVLHAMANKSPYGPNINEAARILIAHGADVDAMDNLGRSGFHAAFKAVLNDAFREERMHDSQRAYLALLLELGANPNCRDKDGRTPLHDSIYVRFYGLAHLLLQSGADPTIKSKRGQSALELAIYYRDKQTAVLSDSEEVALKELIAAMERA